MSKTHAFKGVLLAMVLLAFGGVTAAPDSLLRPTSTAQMAEFTEALMPHALELSANLTRDTRARQGRKLFQAYIPPGSTKPLLTAQPAVPANDGLLTYPQYLQARCQFHIVGNGQYGVITSASINCESVDGTPVLMYVGSSIAAFSAGFKGVWAQVPAPGGFGAGISIDPNAIFLIQAGSIHIYDSTFSNVAVGKNFPVLSLTKGTSPVLVSGSTFDNIKACAGDPSGSTFCLPAIAIGEFTTYVQIVATQFLSCKCENQEICHSGSLYVTDRAVAVLRGVTFDSSVGHFGGALMVTDGAAVKSYQGRFTNNAVAVPGSLGGAIWLDTCQAFEPPYPTITGYGVFDGNYIAGNKVTGTGGGMTITDCPNTIIKNTIFADNKADIFGGAIAIRGSSPGATISSSFFVNNQAVQNFGGAISSDPCNPGTATITNTAFVNNVQGGPSNAQGCDVPTAGAGNTQTPLSASQTAAYNAILAGVGLPPTSG